MRVMETKKRLNLTVRPDFKEQAKQLAKARRRSVSALFEDLIEAEWKRLQSKIQEATDAYGPRPPAKDKPDQKPIGFEREEEHGGYLLAVS